MDSVESGTTRKPWKTGLLYGNICSQNGNSKNRIFSHNQYTKL